MSKIAKKTKNGTLTIVQKSWICGIAVGLFFIIGIIYIHQSFVAFRNTQLINNRFQAYNYSKLVFCYDHNIKPCEDDAIWKWNGDNPADAFDYKTGQELSDEVQLSKY